MQPQKLQQKGEKSQGDQSSVLAQFRCFEKIYIKVSRYCGERFRDFRNFEV